MIAMPFEDIVRAVGALFVVPGERGRAGSIMVRGVRHDSREVEPGYLFVAVRGKNHDGHKFIGEVASRGAVACMADRVGASAASNPAIPLVVVDDTVAALGRLAAHYRQCALPAGVTVVGITGSNGKTTTKCMIDHVLRRTLGGVASKKSFNNNIGVPLTILSASEHDHYVLAEIGTNAPGEIKALADIARPHVAVITSIGEAHLEGLGTLADVAAEKAAILECVQATGLAVVNIDQPEILPHLSRCRSARLITVGRDQSARLSVANTRTTLGGSSFELEGRFAVRLPMPGVHHATNAAAAFAVARWFGVDCEDIVAALRTFSPVEGRTRRLEVGGVTIIDDAYNANPSSVSAAIDTLRVANCARRIFVLGDMLELGPASEAAHRRMVQSIIESRIEVLVGVGEMVGRAARLVAGGDTEIHLCGSVAAAGDLLSDMARPGDAVWVKGSRAVQLDRVVERLTRRETAAAVA
jgi:UDP-N-acetylmuramoyl-tripeptide--D-alanyl-D-alanine ligase